MFGLVILERCSVMELSDNELQAGRIVCPTTANIWMLSSGIWRHVAQCTVTFISEEHTDIKDMEAVWSTETAP
jgi:hypothetical protein